MFALSCLCTKLWDKCFGVPGSDVQKAFTLTELTRKLRARRHDDDTPGYKH